MQSTLIRSVEWENGSNDVLGSVDVSEDGHALSSAYKENRVLSIIVQLSISLSVKGK